MSSQAARVSVVSWRSGFSWVSWDTWLSVVACGASLTRSSFLSSRSSRSRRSWRAHRSWSSSDPCHDGDFSGFTFLTLIDFPSAEVILSSSASSSSGARVGLTHGAALSVRDHGSLAAHHLVTLDLVAQDHAVIAHADTAWLRLPDVPVSVLLTVRLAILVAGVLLLTCDHQSLQPEEQDQQSPQVHL